MVLRATRDPLPEIATDALTKAAAELDEWGFLRARVPVSRTGVFEYADASMPGGKRLEYRAPEEVGDAASVASLHGRPLVLEHPDGAKVTPQNARTSTTGIVLDPEFDAQTGILFATVVVQDAHSIELARTAACRELSCGYLRELIREDGVTPDGQRYTHRQRGIRHNHVAQTQRGRAGPMCALPAFDSADVPLDATPIAPALPEVAPSVDGSHTETLAKDGITSALSDRQGITSPPPPQPEDAEMTTRKIQINGTEHELATDAADAVEALLARLESFEDAAKSQKVATDAADIDAKVATAVAAKLALIDAARSVGVACDSAMADTAIQTAVIRKLAPAARLDGKTPSQIALRYEAEMDRAADAQRALAEASHAQVAVDSAPRFAADGKPVAPSVEDAAAARAKMLADRASRFKHPAL